MHPTAAASAGRRRAPAAISAAAKRAAPAVVSITASKAPRAQPAGRRPVVPLLLRRPRAQDAAAGRPRLGRDRLARRLPAHQQPRGRRRRRHRGAARPTAARHRPGSSAPTPTPTWRCSRSTSTSCPRSRFGNADDAAGRRRRCWRSATRSASARPSPRASSARSAATSSASTPSRTSSRPTPRSTPATPAARWSTPTATCVGINTAIFSRTGGSLGIGFAIPVDTARQVMESLVKDGRVTRGWIGVEPRDLTPEMAETLRPAGQGAAC